MKTFNNILSSLKSTLLVTILLFTCVGVWGADGDNHEWTSYSDWGESTKTSWLRNNKATLPTLSYTPQYAVKKVTLAVRQSNTTGSNTVKVTINGTQVGEIQSMGSGTSSFNMEFSPTSALEGEVKILCTNTSANSTGQGTFFLEKITLTEGSAITYTDYITECSSEPSFSVSTAQLADLNYIANAAVPDRTSEVQTFTVSGSNLTNNITITPNNTNFEISKDGTNYQTTALTLNQTSGSVAQTTISVRLKAGLEASADAYTGTLTVASTGVAESKHVSLSGTVSALALQSISVKTEPTKVIYGVGEKFAPSGLVITRHFNDATTSDLPYAGNESTFTFNPGLDDALTISNTSVQITNSDKSVNQDITMKYVVIWSADGTKTTALFASGAALTLPTAPAAPTQCSSKSFVGWTADGTYSGGDDAPGDLFKAAGSKTVTENKTYYAVWADVTGSGTAGYNKITSTDDLVNGAEYVVGYQYNSSHIIMSATGYNSGTTYLTALSKSPDGNGVIATSDVQDNQKWKLVTSNTKFKLYNENQSKYVNATTESTPTLSMGSGGTDFAITYDNSNARWIVSHADDYYIVGYISSSNYFRAYYSTNLNSGYKIQLYKYTPGATYSDYVVSCTPKVLTKIEVTTNPTKVKYKVGEAFDATGMVVTATYDDASTKTLSSSQYTIDAPAKLATKDVAVTIKANEDVTKTANVAINVLALDHITVTNATTEYEETDYFSTEGMTVTATWGTNPTIVEEIQKGGDNGYTVSKTEPLTLADNNTNVEISYTHEGTTKTANVLITVKEIPTYTVHFYKNGTDDPQTCKRDASVTVPSVVAPKDFEFLGWKTTELAETEDYPTFDLAKDETSYTPTADNETFYAVYKKIHKTEKEGIKLNIVSGQNKIWVGTKSSDYLLAKNNEADAEVFIFEDGYLYYYNYLNVKTKAFTDQWNETEITTGEHVGTVTYGYLSGSDPYYLGYNANQPRFKAYKNNLSTYNGYFTKTPALKILETYTYSTTATPDVLTDLEIVSGATTTTYYEGDMFDKTGIVAKAVYNTGNKLTVTDQLTYNPLLTTALTTANDKVVVSYTENSVSVSKNQSITVKAITLDNIAVTTQPTKKSYKQGDSFDPSGMVVAATYNDSRKDNANVPLKVGEENGYTFSPATFTELGEQNVTISYTDGTRGTQTTTVAVSVNNALTSIEVTTLPTKVVYTRDEYLDKTGMVVTATYEGGSTKDVSGYTTDFDDVAFTVIGTNEVTVTYTESGVIKTDKFDVTVNDYPHYTVTFKYKKGSTDVTEEIGKGGVTPPEIATTVGVYTFAGWSKTNVDLETTTKPAYVTLTEGKYYPTESETLYAVYTTNKIGRKYGFTLKVDDSGTIRYISSLSSNNLYASTEAANAMVFYDEGNLMYTHINSTKNYLYNVGTDAKVMNTTEIATAATYPWVFEDNGNGTVSYKIGSRYLCYSTGNVYYRFYAKGDSYLGNLIKETSESYVEILMDYYFSNPSAAIAGTASFAEETPEISVVDDKMQKNTYTNILTTNSTGAKTYESSDEEVATVDNTGKVTVVKGGTVTISVTIAEVEDEFTEAKANYTLTISRLTPTVTKTLTENPTVYKGYSIDVADFFETNSDGVKSYSLSSTAFGTLDGSTYTVTGTPGNSSYVNVYLETAESDIYAYKKSEAQYVKVRPLVAQTLSFANASYTFTYGESVADFTNELTGASTTVTYESSDKAIATVDATGQVHMVTTSVSSVVTITAKAKAEMAGGIGYSAAEKSYTITIKHAAPGLNLTAGEYHTDQLLEITAGDDAYTIYYTNNGDDVTWDGEKSNGTEYPASGILLEQGTTTIKAIAIYELNSELVASSQASATYNLVAPDAPVFSWKEGQTVTTSDVLTITCDEKKYYIDYLVVGPNGETVQKGSSNVSPVSIKVSAMGTYSVEAFTYWKDTKKADSYKSDVVESTFLMQGPASLPYAYNEFSSGIPGCFTTSGTGTYTGSGNTKTQVKFTETGHGIVFQCNEQMNNLYYTVKHNKSDDAKTFESAGNIFTVSTSANGSSYTTLKTHTTMATSEETIEITNIPATARYIKWEYTKKADNKSGNVGLGNIKVGLLPMAFTSGINDMILKPNDMVEWNATVSASDYAGTITYTAPDDLDESQLELSEGYLWAYAGPYTANFTVTAMEDDRYARLTTTAPVEVCGTYTREASKFSAGTISTICLPNAVKADYFEGCTVYEVAGRELVGGEPYKIFFDQVFSLEAGKPYVIELNEGAKQADLYYHGTAVANPDNKNTNGLIGTFTAIDDATNGNSVLMGNYMIYSNQIKKCGTGCLVGANKAYIQMGDVPEISTNPAPAPGRRRIVLGNADVNTPTGMVNVNTNENAIQKLIINNQVIIIRNGQMYNAQGALLK